MSDSTYDNSKSGMYPEVCPETAQHPPAPVVSAMGTAAHTHSEPRSIEASPTNASRRPGAPAGNANALKTAVKRTASSGSKLGKALKHEERLVADLVARVALEWHAKHGSGPMPVVADNLLQQVRRGAERDRIAARLLRTLKDLKGNELTHDQQNQQREIQAAALRLIEGCLAKLGLAASATATDPSDPFAEFDREREQASRGTPQRPATASKPPEATAESSLTPQTLPKIAEKFPGASPHDAATTIAAPSVEVAQ